MEQMKTITNTTVVKGDTNRDPLSGEPGAHPVGVGTGAVGGGLAGAAVGAVVAGPIGAGVGAVVGAVSGGLAGKSAAEAINPTTEHEFWRVEYRNRPYFTPDTGYEQFGPAYQYGWESYESHQGTSFLDAEAQMARDWESRRGQSRLNWNHVKSAAQDAWDRVEKSTRGDSRSSK